MLMFSEIPHFKEVVIMATVCDSCGHKTNEVKSGGGIEATGKKMTLTVKGHKDPAKTEEDLSRDILKVGIFGGPKGIFLVFKEST